MFDWNRRRGWYIMPRSAKRGIRLHGMETVQFVGRALGCLFWRIIDGGHFMLCLHGGGAEFSRLRIPDRIRALSFRVIGSTDEFVHSKVRIVCAEGDTLLVFAMLRFCNGEWVAGCLRRASG